MTGVVARAQSIKPGTVHALYERVRSERGVRSADAQNTGGICGRRAGLACELLGVMRSSDNHEDFICNNSDWQCQECARAFIFRRRSHDGR